MPKNREKITKALVSTVQNELLSKETIRARLQQIHFLERGLELAERHLDNVALHKGLSTLAKQALNAIDLEKLTPLLAEEIHKALQDVDTSRLVSTIVDSIVMADMTAKRSILSSIKWKHGRSKRIRAIN